jgi:hypothetical protein
MITSTPALSGLLTPLAGTPWPAAAALGVAGLAVAAVLAWRDETHRHAEVVLALQTGAATTFDATAVVAVLRNEKRHRR